jgi:aspartate/methionine/tyrosine aminotransferase
MLWEKHPHSAFHIDPEVFISTNSLTKAYGLSGIRCGWVLASPEIVQRIRHFEDLHMGTNVHPAELMGVIAFQKLDQIAAKQKKRLDENRKLLREVLESQSILEYFWPEYGAIIFPRVKGRAAKFVERLRAEYELSVVPGEFFEDPQRIRIGVSGPTESVRASLRQLRKALAEPD